MNKKKIFLIIVYSVMLLLSLGIILVNYVDSIVIKSITNSAIRDNHPEAYESAISISDLVYERILEIFYAFSGILILWIIIATVGLVIFLKKGKTKEIRNPS